MSTMTTIDATRFGVLPDTRDCGEAFRALLDHTLTIAGPKVIELGPGEYHVWPPAANRRELYLANTAGADLAVAVKEIGVLIDGQRRLSIRGDRSRIVVHGKTIMVALIDCEDVTIEGIEWDVAVSTVVDLLETVGGEDAGGPYRSFTLPPDITAEVVDGSIVWKGESLPDGSHAWQGTGELGVTQRLNLSTASVHRVPPSLFPEGSRIDIRGDQLRVGGPSAATAYPGHVHQFRVTARDTTGALVLDSGRVVLRSLTFRHLGGFGLLFQNTGDVLIDGCAIAADHASRRYSSSSADGIHAAGCRGRITVRDTVVDNPHDDAINVHGFYLQIVAVLGPRRLRVAFKHPQTAGIAALLPGDEILIVDPDRLIPVEQHRIVAVDGPSGRDHSSDLHTCVIELEGQVSSLVDHAVIENLSTAPRVLIEGCTFSRVPTRGVLVSTRGATLIKSNRFERPGMAAIFVSADAQEWWEAGPVTDLLIEDNDIVAPTGPGVLIEPSVIDDRETAPVHARVRIADNRILDASVNVDAFAVSRLEVGSHEASRMRARACGEVLLIDTDLPPGPSQWTAVTTTRATS